MMENDLDDDMGTGLIQSLMGVVVSLFSAGHDRVYIVIVEKKWDLLCSPGLRVQ